MSPAGTTQMLYDVWDHLLAETDGASHVVKQYIWVGDEPVAVLDGTSNAASPTLYYVHADHLQRPELMTNAAGSVVWTAYYEPFGAVSSITGPVTENQRFPGQWFQLEQGLAYNWHRHYDPTIGRYTSPDPLGLFLSPQPSAPQTIVGGTVDSGSGTDLTGVTDAPATPAVDSGAYPASLAILSDVEQPAFGLAIQTPLANATVVQRSGSSFFGYSSQDVLLQTDISGLISGLSPKPLPSDPINFCATKKRALPNMRCDGPNSVCSMGTPGQFPDPTQPGKLLCWDCYVKTFGRP